MTNPPDLKTAEFQESSHSAPGPAVLGNLRRELWDKALDPLFDVVILGGGVNGACLYHNLCSRGYRVGLLDRRDFAAGTSQASGMMVWGGLLYLRNLDLGTVFSLSTARDAMIADSARVRGRSFRYVYPPRGGRGPLQVRAALHLYWAMGCCRRKRPRTEGQFAESVLLRNGAPRGSIVYEEGMLDDSDARFTLDWMTPHSAGGNVALNHARLDGGQFHPHDKLWRLDVADRLGTHQGTVRTRCLVNSTGAWTDRVNAQFGIRTPVKHVFSKGVYMCLERNVQHLTPMIFETDTRDDHLTWVPWGPVAMFGPTETVVDKIEDGYRVTAEDLELLMREADSLLQGGARPSQVVSLRCGLRSLVVPHDYVGNGRSTGLSRRSRCIPDPDRPWFSIYGGKLTGCQLVADEVAQRLQRHLPTPQFSWPPPPGPTEAVRWTHFPGLVDPVPSPEWCVQYEACCTLEDYLRRRTNIAQWVPREGLGRNGENYRFLLELNRRCFTRTDQDAVADLDRYVQRVENRFDAPLSHL